MSAGVLSLAPIVAHLRGACPSFREISDAAGLARIAGRPAVYPSAFVLPLSDRAVPSRYADCSVVAQRVTAGFGVLMAARDLRPDLGTEALSELEMVRAEARVALLGWRPPGAVRSCRLSAGRLISGVGRDGGLVWQDDWTAETELEALP